MTELVDARPTWAAHVGLTAGAFDDLSTVVWSTLPDVVDLFELRRGRQHELRSTEPATGRMVLDNVDRRFDPTYVDVGAPYASAGVSHLANPRRRLRIPLLWGDPLTIDLVSNTTPIVIVTLTPHGLATGDMVRQSGVTGNLAANGYFQVGAITGPSSYEILGPYTGAPVAPSGFYIAGGTAQPMFWRFHGYIADFPASWQAPNVAKAEVEIFDAFAIFNEIPIPGSPWELVVAADSPSFWFRPGAGAVAFDVSGHNRHGTYQGRPGFEDGIIPGYDAAGFAPNRDDTPGARASFPHKSLITGFPFTVECVIQSGQERSADKVILSAFSAAFPTSGGQNLIFVLDSNVAGFGGHLRGRVSDNDGTVSSYVRSSVTVDDGQPHHVVWVARAFNDMEMWVDGVNVSGVSGATSAFPTDLSVGYAVGNYPAIAYGDFSFATQSGDALGDVVIYDGVSLGVLRILDHHEAAITGWEGDTTGVRLDRLLDWVGWPSADRDIDTGITTLPAGMVAGNLLPYLQALERAEAGLVYMGRNGKVILRDRHRALTSPGNVSQFTFGDGVGEIAYDPPAVFGGTESEHITRAEGNRVGGPRQTAVSANESASGVKVIRALSPPLSDLQVRTDEICTDRLHYELGRYEMPRTRVRSVTVRPQEDPDVAWPAVLAVEDGAMVTFTASPPGGGSEFSQASHLEATAETWTAGDVVITYALSPADLTTYAQFGTAQFGTAIFGF